MKNVVLGLGKLEQSLYKDWFVLFTKTHACQTNKTKVWLTFHWAELLVHVHVGIYIYVHIYIYIIYIYICVFCCVYSIHIACVYIYIYIHIYIHVCVLISQNIFLLLDGGTDAEQHCVGSRSEDYGPID